MSEKASRSKLPRKPRKRPLQARHWCFTINNPVAGDLPTPAAQDQLFSYIIVGKEIGDNGTPHLQGYCVLKKRKRLTGMRKLFPRAHLEIARGTPTEASAYCMKDGDYCESGELPKTAAQTSSDLMTAKWEEAWQKAKAGNIEDISSPFIRVNAYSALKRIQQDYPAEVADLDDVCGIWIYGKTGSGKSYNARKWFQPFYDKPLTKWWDGYRGQPNVIVDDVNAKQAPWIGTYLKRWGDRYSFPNEHKGTGHQIRPERIIVTSQHRIHELFDGAELDAIQRRFYEIRQFREVETFREYYLKSRRKETSVPPGLFLAPSPAPTPSPDLEELSDTDDDLDL